MANDENDIPMSETSNQKAQKLPIYSNESKILKLLGQAQVADQKTTDMCRTSTVQVALMLAVIIFIKLRNLPSHHPSCPRI